MTGTRWRAALAAAALVVVAAGCQWVPSIRYDDGNSGYNQADTTLTPANVTAMTTRFTAPLGNLGPHADYVSIYPVYVDGHVLVPTVGALRGYDATGAGCSTPATCVPTWTGDFGAPWLSYSGGDVDGSHVFAEASDTFGVGKLFAFDTADSTGCGGTPWTCPPQWTAAVNFFGTPTVAGGRVYAYDAGTKAVEVFDAAGVTGCGGTPKVCQPLWTAPVPDTEPDATRLAVVGGSVYALTRHGVLTVSDAAGVQGCAGTPLVCQPLWTAIPPGGPSSNVNTFVSPLVAEGKVFFPRTRENSVTTGDVFAYDAAGATNCSGIPKTCQPLWSVPVGQAGANALSVAEGRLYVPDRNAWATRVYDVNGSGCTGSPTPTDCPVLFSFGEPWTVTIDHGLALQSATTGFVAYGATGCGGAPCTPVASTALGPRFYAFIIGDHKVFGISVTERGDATLTAAW